MKSYESWFSCTWRPAAAWVYLGITIFDFVVSPIVYSWFQYALGQPIAQWTPLTLQGGGLLHISYGAIVGINAWTRTIEKMKVNTGDDSKSKHKHKRYDDSYDPINTGYQHPYEDR